jgi:hypothetical protein
MADLFKGSNQKVIAMAIRALMAESTEEAQYRPYLNTGGPLDIVTGKYVPTTTGTWAMSAGLGFTTAVIAKAHKFKSTLLNGAAVNALARFPDAQMFLYDSETSTVNKPRLAGFSNLYLDEPDKREIHLQELEERMHLFDPGTAQGESLDHWVDFMKSIRDDKIAHFKDYEVETELLDTSTMKPYRMMMPTLIGIDSWTEALVAQLNLKNEEITADTEMSKQRTVSMEEGLKKAMLMRQMTNICQKGGMYAFLTGHLGQKFDIGGQPSQKDMTNMGQGETVKAMGNRFYFLMSVIIKINNAFPLIAKADKMESEYPSASGHIGATELQELLLTVIRSKNAGDGMQLSTVMSKAFGIQTGLSYYNNLTNSRYYGLGSSGKPRNPMLPDYNLGRTKINDACKEYKIQRMLELTYEYMMIQQTWNLQSQPFDYSMPFDLFVEKLNGTGYAIDDILNSRGWWTYKGAKVERELLTLPDIMMILDGSYKPKFFAVTSGKA